MADFKKLADKTKKEKKSKSTALISMAELEKMYATEAKQAAEAAPIAGGVMTISLEGEQFQIGEQMLPDQIDVIVVAEVMVNVYYDSPYDKNDPSSPACFAVALANKGADAIIASHESSPNRQGGVDFKCQSCEMNKFGSAAQGRGKACTNRRKLAVVFSNDPALQNDDELKWCVMNLPPTSLGDWGKFVLGLDRVEHRPPHGVTTRFEFDRRNPDAQKRKRVIATGYQKITDVRVAMKINALRKQLLDSGELVQPLPVDNYRDPSAPKKPTTAKVVKTVKPKAAPAKGVKNGRAARF
jgi:hypothetical protein